MMPATHREVRDTLSAIHKRRGMQTTVMESENNITIMRVGNGWVIRSESMIRETQPLMVATDPEQLGAIVQKWARAQEAETTQCNEEAAKRATIMDGARHARPG